MAKKATKKSGTAKKKAGKKKAAKKKTAKKKASKKKASKKKASKKAAKKKAAKKKASKKKASKKKASKKAAKKKTAKKKTAKKKASKKRAATAAAAAPAAKKKASKKRASKKRKKTAKKPVKDRRNASELSETACVMQTRQTKRKVKGKTRKVGGGKKRSTQEVCGVPERKAKRLLREGPSKMGARGGRAAARSRRANPLFEQEFAERPLRPSVFDHPERPRPNPERRANPERAQRAIKRMMNPHNY